MSMDINELGYAASIYPNTSASMTKDVEKLTETKETKTQQSEAPKQATVLQPRYDTIEISEEGRAASDLMQEQKDPSQAAQVAKTEEQENTTSAAQPAKAEGYAPEEEEDPTDDLSSLTKTELKQLYLKGDITKTEYDEELADRGILGED